MSQQHTSSVLTVYYDGSCPLCRAEMEAVESIDEAGRLELKDVSRSAFEDECVLRSGKSQQDLMQALHVRDRDGRWSTGVDAFAEIYRHAGLPGMAQLWSHPRWAPLLRRGYPWIVRQRSILSKMGLAKLLGWLIRRYADRVRRRNRT